jgi:ubiquinone/menaquinone biosynthesis C-methylase UbiE
MTVFRWTAPLFKLVARRWAQDDFEVLAESLRPFVAPGGIFADLGGGTGDLGAGVAQALGARVIILDPTPQMLRRVGAHPLVSVQLAGAESLPFPDAYFDAVLCCDAFHHFREQEAAADEMARVVRPGGGVLVMEAEASNANRRWAILERLLGEPAAFRTIPDMERFLDRHGIAGTSAPQKGTSYTFVGSVRPSP